MVDGKEREFPYCYPPQAYDPNLAKVALISDDTAREDLYTWVHPGDTYTNISKWEKIIKAMEWYDDNSIDVLIFSGHSGNNCSARSSGKNLGGYEMDPKVYEIIRRKLSRKGQVLILSCGAGTNAEAMQLTANAFGVPVTAADDATYTTALRSYDRRFRHGGATCGKYITVRPLSPLDIAGLVGGATGIGGVSFPGVPVTGGPSPLGGGRPIKKPR